MPLPIAEVLLVERTVWKFATADWDRLDALLHEEDWSQISRMTPDMGAQTLSDTLMRHAGCCIQKKNVVEKKSTHPWLNDVVVCAIADRRDAEGTPSEAEAARECSKTVMTEYNKWVCNVHDDLVTTKRGSKAWWKKQRQLQLQKQKCSSIPALKKLDGDWVGDSQGKADLLAETLSSKYSLPEQSVNEYSELKPRHLQWIHDRSSLLTHEAAQDIMSNFREDSATGLDAVPTRIIKRCAAALARPVYMLGMTILATGHWPLLYTQYWIACLFKKKKTFSMRQTIVAYI